MGLFRLLLAVSILIAHSSPIFGLNLVGGRVAVETFFLLSGFYMGLVLTEKYQKNLKTFYRNRFLKIFPQYWLFLFLCLIVGLISKVGIQAFFDYQLNPVSKIFLFLVNLTPVGQNITNYLALNPNTGSLFFTSAFRDFKPEIWNFLLLPQAWMISLELFFYLLVPWLNRQKTKTLLYFCLISLAIRLFLLSAFHLSHDPWEYRFFPNELLFFVSGILSYRLYKTLKTKISPIYIIPIFAFLLFYQFIPHQTIKMIVFYALAFFTLPPLFQFTKNFKLDRILGDISYPLYLSHFLIINIFTQIVHVNQYYLGFLTLLVCLPLSFLTYFFFQKRLTKL
jgi:peptidoglycan/LPS O-acetylase OafA/YrhL